MAKNPFKSPNEPEDPALPSRAVTSMNEPPPPPAGDSVEPLIDTLEPASCAIGDPDFTLYVHGDNFFPGSIINFAGHDEPTTLNDDGTLSTGVKPSLWQAPATVECVVRNGALKSAPVTFEFTAPAGRGSRAQSR
jgi:hypothetical protein